MPKLSPKEIEERYGYRDGDLIIEKPADGWEPTPHEKRLADRERRLAARREKVDGDAAD
jgi:hypothetical protein